jgi:hypothetical protein
MPAATDKRPPPLTTTTNRIFQSLVHKKWVIFVFIMVVLFLLLISFLGGGVDANNHFAQVLVITLPFFAVLAAGAYTLTASSPRGLVYATAAFLSAGAFYAFYQWTLHSVMFSYISTIWAYILLFLLLLLTHGVLLEFFDTWNTRNDWIGFVIDLVIYIPCLIRDLIQWILGEYSNTTNNTLLWIAIESVLLLLFFLSPIAQPTITSMTSTQTLLLNDAVALTVSTPLADMPTPLKSHYAFSLWLNINYRSSQSVRYSQPRLLISWAGGLHQLYYVPPAAAATSSIVPVPTIVAFLFISGPPRTMVQSYDTAAANAVGTCTIPFVFQKWNNLVFNFQTPMVDVFVNGTLENTISITNPPKFDLMGKHVVVGDNHGGVEGVVASVAYYNTPLSAWSASSIPFPPSLKDTTGLQADTEPLSWVH